MISPTRLAIGPADIGTTQKFLVVNQGQAAANVNVQKQNFIGAADGSLTFQADAPYSASEWVTVDPMTFEIAPGATQTVTAKVTLPENPDAGDHQMAIVFLVPSGQTSANIKINRGIGTPMYITVPGPIDDSVRLNTFQAPGFAIGGPVTLTAQLDNTGTVHRDFRGDHPLRIDTAGETTQFPDFTVVRGGTRDISTDWEPPLMCICNPSITVVNADGSVQTMSQQVIVFPLQWLGIAIGVGLLIGLLIFLVRRRYRSSVTKAATALQSRAAGGDG